MVLDEKKVESNLVRYASSVLAGSADRLVIMLKGEIPNLTIRSIVELDHIQVFSLANLGRDKPLRN